MNKPTPKNQNSVLLSKKPSKIPLPKKSQLRATRKAENERLAREEEKRCQRVRLSIEAAYAIKTTMIYDKRWKQMVLSMPKEDMQQSLLVAWNAFDRIMDVKDYRISILLDELDITEDQTVKAYGNFVHNVDRLLNMYHDELEKLKKRFISNIEQCEKDASTLF